MNTQNEHESQEREALCPECGHAFKTYMDRILNEGKDTENKKIDCPVCGCGDCHIGK
jgi:C4-type Zn-finger protein